MTHWHIQADIDGRVEKTQCFRYTHDVMGDTPLGVAKHILSGIIKRDRWYVVTSELDSDLIESYVEELDMVLGFVEAFDGTKGSREQTVNLMGFTYGYRIMSVVKNC